MKITLVLDEERQAKLRELMEKTGSTPENLIRSAMTLFEWAIGQVEQGWSVGSVAPDAVSYKEVTMPTLTNVAENKSAAAFVDRLEVEFQTKERALSFKRAMADLDPDCPSPPHSPDKPERAR
jgi:hypothetical protein